MAFSGSLHRSAARPIAHARELWGNYWLLPLVPALYAATIAAIGGLRSAHLIIALAIAALGFGTTATKRFVSIAYPLLFIGAAYDLYRHAQPALLAQATRGCWARNLDLDLFAAAPNTTWQDYFAIHHTPFLDLFFSIPYAGFIFVVAGYAVYLSFIDELRSRQFIWAVTISYLLAIAIWMALPTAPPWYVRAYGCAINVSAPASAAGLVQVDQLLGIAYFQDFYSHSPAIFGAFPSMHCAFPVIGLIVGWRGATWITRPIHVFYALAMFAGSIYLDHHWIIDGIAGWTVAAAGAYASSPIVARLRHSPPGGERFDPDAIIVT